MKKGFTLIELLAVIVLIGALSVLTIPKIVNTLKESGKSIDSASAKGLLSSAEYKASQNELKGVSGNTIIDFETETNIDALDYNGEVPEKGKIILKENGQVDMAIKLGDTCYIKNKLSQEIQEIPYSEETCIVSISFEEDSWNVIKAYLRKDRNFYEIGSLKEIEIDINGDETIDSSESFTVRLSNTSTPEECDEEGFSQTACGVVIEFIDEIANRGLNSYDYPNAWSNEGGWPGTEMHTYLNETIYEKLPEDLKSVIIDTYTVSGHGESDSENLISTDKLYLLSTGEIWNVHGEHAVQSAYLITSFDTAYYDTRQLDYYEAAGMKHLSINDCYMLDLMTSNFVYICEPGEYNAEVEAARKNTTYGTWWLRTARAGSSTYFRVEGIEPHSDNAVSQFGITPAFRIL